MRLDDIRERVDLWMPDTPWPCNVAGECSHGRESVNCHEPPADCFLWMVDHLGPARGDVPYLLRMVDWLAGECADHDKRLTSREFFEGTFTQRRSLALKAADEAVSRG